MTNNMRRHLHQSQTGLGQLGLYPYDAAAVIKAMEGTGQVIAVAGNTLGGIITGRPFDFLRILLNLL